MNKIIYIFLLIVFVLGFGTIFGPGLAHSDPSNIIAAEYYVDVDPGEGQGSELEAVDDLFDSPNEQVQIPLDTSGLTIGVHYLYIRMQNEETLWGTPRKIPFEVTGDKNISAAEYFVDVPCEGTGITMTPAVGTFDQIKETAFASIDTSDLTLGIHTVYVRMKDGEDHWGTCTGYKIEIREPPYIIGAEYFVDEDPGPGFGAAINCSDLSWDSSIEDIDVKFRAWCYSVGDHDLFVRALDSYQRWGVNFSVPFYIDEAPLDVCEGDVNGDHVVNILDKVIVRNYFGQSSNVGWWFDADINCDGVVNILDKVRIRNDFGCSY